MNIEERIRLEIKNQDDVQANGVHENTDYLISIDDPDIEPTACPPPHPGRHAHFKFHDICFHPKEDMSSLDPKYYLPPSKQHMEVMIRYFKEIKDIPKRPVHVVIHCHAGISRSTAAAMILLQVIFGPGHEKETMRHISYLRPVAYPNERMLLFAGEILGCGEAMNLAADAWKEFSTKRAQSLFG